jgi:hypothetical protein
MRCLSCLRLGNHHHHSVIWVAHWRNHKWCGNAFCPAPLSRPVWDVVGLGVPNNVLGYAGPNRRLGAATGCPFLSGASDSYFGRPLEGVTRDVLSPLLNLVSQNMQHVG